LTINRNNRVFSLKNLINAIMKFRVVILSTVVAAFLLSSCGKGGGKFANLNDSASYAFGLSIGRNLETYHAKNIDYKILAQAVEDVLSGDTSKVKMNDQVAMTIIQSYFTKLQKETADNNLKEGKEFLEKNKKESGVVTTPEGLQYKIESAGDAAVKATPSDTVVVNYTGKFLDGKEFDSSKKNGMPARFVLGGVIPGWTQGLQLIGKGGKIKLFIPANLAYGERGAGGVIPANATLIFEVELLDVIKGKAAPATK
jgi:FKBP-type peptidyl-prolyl cis-trans isomerase